MIDYTDKNNPNLPPWAKLLWTPADQWSHSSEDHSIQMNSYGFLKKVAPEVYDAAGQEIKEFNEYHILNGNTFDKVKLGRRICSIPIEDYVLHPELQRDPKALKKYLEEHPELKAQRYNGNSNKLANGPGFNLNPR